MDDIVLVPFVIVVIVVVFGVLGYFLFDPEAWK
jgi:hypothetical protein